jgi:hypothetical protein
MEGRWANARLLGNVERHIPSIQRSRELGALFDILEDDFDD